MTRRLIAHLLLFGTIAVAVLARSSQAALVGYWDFNDSGSIGLNSVTSEVLSVAGDAQYTSSGRAGGGLLLDGSGDYLWHNPTTAAPTGTPIGNSSYTLSAWIKPTATGDRGIVGWGNYGSSRQVNAFRLMGSSSFRHYWWGADIDRSYAPVNLLDGNWHHVLATYNGKVRSLWLDGQRLGLPDTPGTNNAQAMNFAIGKTYSTEYFAGTMDDVAIYNGSLTANQVQALASGASPTSLPLPDPVDRFVADSLNALGNGRVLANGDWASSFGSASANVAAGDATLRTNALGPHAVVNFDGDDYLQIVNGAMTTTAGGDFSIVAVYRTNAGAGGETQYYLNTSIVDSEQSGVTNDWGLNINANGRLAAGLGNPDVTQYSASGGYYKDGLAHVAVYTRTGSTVSLYVDGNPVGSRTDGGTAVRNAVDYFFGGNHTGGNKLTGDIAEARVYDVALSAAEVAALSANLLGTYAGSLYQRAVLADGPSHYYRLGEGTTTAAKAYDEVGMNHGTYMNAPAVNQAGALGIHDFNTAVRFDGTNDYVAISNDLPTSFTIECLINTSVPSRTGTQAYHGDGVIWSDVAGVADDFLLAMLNNHAAFFDGDAAGGGGATIQGTTDLTDGRWHHIVVTRQSGGLMQLFVDNVLEASAPAGIAILDDNPNIHIGGNTLDSRFFNGLIDEVAFYGYVLTPSQIFQHYAAFMVPEPSALLLGALGLALVALGRRRTARSRTGA